MYASVSSTFPTYVKTFPLDSSTAHRVVVLFISFSINVDVFKKFHAGVVYSQLCPVEMSAGVMLCVTHASADTGSLSEGRNV
jgi:hypothetical protein